MTSAEFEVLIRNYIQKMQLPAALSRLCELLKRSSDAEANHASQQAMACATAAASDNQRLVSALQSVSTYIQTVEAGAPHAGSFDLSFSGTPNQTVTFPVTGGWITTSTVVIAMEDEPGSSPYFGAFDVWVENVAGGSFDIKCRNTAAPVGTYSFKWVAVSTS